MSLTSRLSPAAFWHAKLLKIDPSRIRGSGPKGHILKSDILSIASQQTSTQVEATQQLQLLVPCAGSLKDELIDKGLKRALNVCNVAKDSVHFQRIPEYGIQVQVKEIEASAAKKLSQLLPLLFQDPRYMLL